LGDEFGRSVSVDGKYLVIGAPEKDFNEDNEGAVYVYEKIKNKWIFKQLVVPSITKENFRFGKAVSISGTQFVVGAESVIGEDRVFIFEKICGFWVETRNFTSPDNPGAGGFGFSVSIDGNQVVVGAINTIFNGIQSGVAYVYEKDLMTGWPENETQILLPSDSVARDLFGWSVSIYGNQIAVGGKQSDGGEGAVYVFERSEVAGTWNQTAKVKASDAAMTGFLGCVVSIYENKIVATNRNPVNPEISHVYVYIKNYDGIFGFNSGWPKTETLLLTVETGVSSGLRQGLDLSGGTIIYGNDNAIVNGIASGGAYYFEPYPNVKSSVCIEKIG